MRSGCEICAQAPVCGTERTPCWGCTGPAGHYQHWSWVSEHRDNEMSHGCTGTTRKQKHSRRNGSIPSPLGRKKRDRCEQNQSDAVFFDIHGIVHHEYAPVGQWRKSTINKLSADSVMQFGAKDQTSVRRNTGSCIMTMLQHIHRTRSNIYWRNMEFVIHQPPYSRHGSLRLLVLSEIEDIERIPFWVEKRKCRTRRRNEQHSKRSLPEVFSAAEASVGCVWWRKEPNLKGIRVPIPSPK